MIRDNLVTEAQSMIEDPTYWTAARCTTLLNRGMRDLANHFGVAVPGYFKFDSVQGQQTYMVPTDLIANKVLYHNSTNNQKITIVKGPEVIYGVVTDPTEQGTPTRGYFWATGGRVELWIYPTFKTGGTDIEWFYWRRPPDLVLGNDEPLIPRPWHTYLVDYVDRYIWAKDQERGWSWSQFDAWWEGVKLRVQVSDVMAESASRQIEFGIFDNNLPRVTGQSDMYKIGNDGDTIW